jgi:hypothetical protein
MNKKKHKTAATASVGADVQALLFFLLIAGCAAFLAWKIWPIREIYINKETRAAVESTLTRLQDRQGWLLSDITLLRVQPDMIKVLNGPHRRGTDPSQCVYALTNIDRTTSCESVD